jgi:hypothetical protein
MAIIITPKTFGSVTLNDSSYKTTIVNARGSSPGAVPNFLSNNNADSQYSGLYTVDLRNLVLRVRAIGASPDALAETMRNTFARGTDGALVGTFADDGKDYSINCVVQNILLDDAYKSDWLVTLQSGDTDWVSVDWFTDTWAVTGTGGTKAITVGGSKPTRLVATFTATVLPTLGYLYQNMYRLVNVPGVNYNWRPWCMTVNHAALVAAGKSQADGDDLRIFIGEKETKRWIDTPDSATTKIWFNVPLQAGAALTLKTAIGAATTITKAEFDVNSANQRYLAVIPKQGIIYHGTEWMAYSDSNATTCELTISERGTLGTTKQAHSVADIFYYIQNPIYLVYGNSAVTAPSTGITLYDNTKPLFDLNASNNALWVYTAATLFYDPANPNRTGAWKFTQKKLGNVSRVYNITGNATSGAPALGMLAGSYQVGTTWRTDTYTLSWQMYNPGGMYRFSSTGRKYRGASAWFNTAEIRRSPDGATWTVVASEATPATPASWGAALTQTLTAIDAATKYLQFYVSGQFSLQNARAFLEALTATVEFSAANIPSAAFLGETSNYPLDFKFENVTNDCAVNLLYQMRLNKPFVLDSENSLVTYGGLYAFKAFTMDDESRDVYIPLKPGSNTLQITGVDCGEITAGLAWKQRRT